MATKDYFRTNQGARYFRERISAVKSLRSNPHKALSRELSLLQVDCVLDGGANVGQFGLDLYRHGYEGAIYSYEPVSKIFNTLSKTAKKYPDWHCYNLGLGSQSTFGTINVSGNAGLSSSILEMKESHLFNFPSSGTIAKESIQITTIADQIRVLELNPKKLAVKLDVQGFEYQALLGIGDFLKEIPICFLELSIETLYKNEPDYLKILTFLADSGHELVDLFRGVTAKDGALLQIDVVTRQRK
jgi:FkbM family methyltransferase